MKLRTQFIVAGLVVLGGASPLLARSAGAPERHSGAPGDTICTECHTNQCRSIQGPATSPSNSLTARLIHPGKPRRLPSPSPIRTPGDGDFQASPRVASDAAKRRGNHESVRRQHTDHRHQSTRCNGSRILPREPGPEQPARKASNSTGLPPQPTSAPVDFYVAAKRRQ